MSDWLRIDRDVCCSEIKIFVVFKIIAKKVKIKKVVLSEIVSYAIKKTCSRKLFLEISRDQRILFLYKMAELMAL